MYASRKHLVLLSSWFFVCLQLGIKVLSCEYCRDSNPPILAGKVSFSASISRQFLKLFLAKERCFLCLTSLLSTILCRFFCGKWHLRGKCLNIFHGETCSQTRRSIRRGVPGATPRINYMGMSRCEVWSKIGHRNQRFSVLTRVKFHGN